MSSNSKTIVEIFLVTNFALYFWFFWLLTLSDFQSFNLYSLCHFFIHSTEPLPTSVSVRPATNNPNTKLTISWNKATRNPQGLVYKVQILGQVAVQIVNSNPFTLADNLMPGKGYSVTFWSTAGTVSSDTTMAKSYTGLSKWCVNEL